MILDVVVAFGLGVSGVRGASFVIVVVVFVFVFVLPSRHLRHWREGERERGREGEREGGGEAGRP